MSNVIQTFIKYKEWALHNLLYDIIVLNLEALEEKHSIIRHEQRWEILNPILAKQFHYT